MRRSTISSWLLIAVFAAGASGLGASASAQSGPPEDSDATEAVVNRVIDGSTLDAQVNGHRLPIGYLGVDTPPVNEPCGQAALERNRELVGQHVQLMSDPAYGFDVQGRRLYYVFTTAGVSVDQTLISEGLGHAVRTDGLQGAQLQAAEDDAAANGRGCVWGQGVLTTTSTQ